MPLFMGFFTSQVLQDFFHQQSVDTFDTCINRISFRRWRKQRNWPGNRKLNEYGSKWWGWLLAGASCSMVQRSLPCPAEFDRGLQKCWRGQPWSNRWKTHLEKRYRDDPTGRLWENTRCDLLFLRASTARWKTFLGMVCIGICSTRSEGRWVLLWTLVVGKRWDGASTHWKGAFFGTQHLWTLSVWSKILKLHHIEITRDFDRTPKQLGDVSFEKKLDAWRGMMYIIWWIRFQLAI